MCTSSPSVPTPSGESNSSRPGAGGEGDSGDGFGSFEVFSLLHWPEVCAGPSRRVSCGTACVRRYQETVLASRFQRPPTRGLLGMRLPDDRVPPVLDVIVCAAGHVLFRNLGPLRSHLLYTIPDLLVFFRRPLALEQLRSQMVAPPFPALLAVSIMEASSDRRPALVCLAYLLLPLPAAAPVRLVTNFCSS